MSENRWLATGNFFTSYKAEQRIFLTHADRLIFVCFLVLLFVWPLVFEVSNKYMLVIDSILIAIVAVYGLNLLTGFAGLISIGHAAFVGVGAYTLASFAQILGSDHVLLTHCWPLMILLAGGVGASFGAVVGLPALRLKHLYLVIATLPQRALFFLVLCEFGDCGGAGVCRSQSVAQQARALPGGGAGQ
jgi:branched-chain amino acid transport system permease protein